MTSVLVMINLKCPFLWSQCLKLNIDRPKLHASIALTQYFKPQPLNLSTSGILRLEKIALTLTSTVSMECCLWILFLFERKRKRRGLLSGIFSTAVLNTIVWPARKMPAVFSKTQGGVSISGSTAFPKLSRRTTWKSGLSTAFLYGTSAFSIFIAIRTPVPRGLITGLNFEVKLEYQLQNSLLKAATRVELNHFPMVGRLWRFNAYHPSFSGALSNSAGDSRPLEISSSRPIRTFTTPFSYRSSLILEGEDATIKFSLFQLRTIQLSACSNTIICTQ